MNKNCKLTIGATLLLTTAFSGAEVKAQTCAIPPTCDSLGYTMSEADCDGAVIKCPFDTTKVYCPKLAQDGSNSQNYPCSSKYYLTFSSSSALGNRCDYGSSTPFTTQITLYTPDLICNATNTNPSATPAVSVGFGSDVLAQQKCQSAYLYAMNSKVVGCCNDEGEITTLLPPMLEATGVKVPAVVGEDYYVDGASVGTVVARDSGTSSGWSGVVATFAGLATKTEASALCTNLKTGGLNWSLASGDYTCLLGHFKPSLQLGKSTTNGPWVMTANGYGICAGSLFSDNSYPTSCSRNPDYSTQCKEDALHQVVCVASF